MRILLLLVGIACFGGCANEARTRLVSTNNVKQIGLAMYSHLMWQQKTFPARASFNEDGQPLLSWRVHLLPYLGEEDLYEQFHLDEPWDSPHNKSLIEQMPKVFANPAAPATESGRAHYIVPTSPGSLFEGDKARFISDIRDGSTSTIMLLEAASDSAPIWTRPDESIADVEELRGKVHRWNDGSSVVGFADGSVHQIKKDDIDGKIFEQMLTIAGNDPVD